jgi:hypothetical protein
VVPFVSPVTVADFRAEIPSGKIVVDPKLLEVEYSTM